MDADARSLNDLLESGGLKQMISEPTHKRGHTLDLLIVRESEGIIDNIRVLPAMPSDHAAIMFTAALARPPASRQQVRHRMLRSIDYEQFSRDIEGNFSNIGDLDDLDLAQKVDTYNSTLKAALDKHAAISSRSIQLRPHAPWYDESLKARPRKLRSAERKWRKSGTVTDKQMMKASLTDYQCVLKKAKCAYHREKIAGSNSKELFKVVHELTVERSDQLLPSHSSKDELCQRFSDYFNDKISKLRASTTNVKLSPVPSSTEATLERSACQLEEFHQVSEKDVRKIIKSKKVKTCALDPVPACVFSGCLNTLLPAITDMANQSLMSANFPTSLKSAVVTPILKKQNLDPEDLKNFRPISNIPLLGKVIERVVSQQLTSYLASNSSPI
ncbi:uncharacterized protein LOC121406196 [Lytechinus variegatus]|uniref:uncharacterized protein LOC121406196 n=1 Tax=Lytechinus variegatus TaxID=7654 RepID=UPI001BB2B2E4|nr:uncharacterized protein LOC121406196 [Lytechinus variegatus]